MWKEIDEMPTTLDPEPIAMGSLYGGGTYLEVRSKDGKEYRIERNVPGKKARRAFQFVPSKK